MARPPRALSARSLIAVALLALSAPACNDKAGEAQALKEGLAAAEAAGRIKPLTEAAPTSPAELRGILRRSFHTLGPTLGPRRFTVKSEFTLERKSKPEVALVESLVLEVDAEGSFALSHRNATADSQDGQRRRGRRCWLVGGRYFTARAQGPATELLEAGDAPSRCLDSAIEPLTGMVRLMADHMTVTSAEQVAVGGRPALTVVLSRAGSGVELPPALPLAWPEGEVPPEARFSVDAEGRPIARPPMVVTHTRPMDLRGVLKLDMETGLPLEGKLSGSLLAVKEKQSRELKFEISLSSEIFEGRVPLPEDARMYGARARLFKDCEALLGEGGCIREAGEEVALPAPGDAPPLQIQRGQEEEAEAASGEEKRGRKRRRRRRR